MLPNILILGGYGNFGKRISETLAKHANISLLVAGRNLEKANQLCEKLRAESCQAELKPIALDIFSNDFPQQLKNLHPFLVIHTSGPFQGQDYRVPQACIDAGFNKMPIPEAINKGL